MERDEVLIEPEACPDLTLEILDRGRSEQRGRFRVYPEDARC
jgi:hypothetical protein